MVAEALSLPLDFDARLRERDVGHWSGKSKQEIEETDGETLRAFFSDDPTVCPGGGESTHVLRARAFAAIESIASRWPDEHTIIVTHLGWIRSLIPDADISNAGQLSLVAETMLAEPIEAGIVTREGTL